MFWVPGADSWVQRAARDRAVHGELRQIAGPAVLSGGVRRAEPHWCAIGGIPVNHWAAEPMVTRDVDFVVAVAPN